MNKYLKLTALSIIMIAFIFIITGCVSKDKKETKKSVFEVEQVSDTSIKATFENAKVGEEKTAKIEITEGLISTDYKMEGAQGVNVYYYKAGTKLNKDAADYEYINGEGNSNTEDFPSGSYEVLFEVIDDGATGTIKLEAK